MLSLLLVLLGWTATGAASSAPVAVHFVAEAVELPVVDPWEQARLAGVDFRAIGQEPGWLADIWDGQRIELLLDYGDTRITTPLSSPETGADGRTTVYRTDEVYGPMQLTVTITPGTCYDPMSGEAFPASVVVQIAGSPREYTGCGRWLQ